MKRTILLYFIGAMVVALTVWIGLGTSRLLTSSETNELKAGDLQSKEIIRCLQAARVSAFGHWLVLESHGKSLSYIIQAFDHDPNYETAGMKLMIIDDTGKAVYEDNFSNIQCIFPVYALRKPLPQLVIEGSEGGSMSFLQILDYDNGKVVDLMAQTRPNNSFTVNAEVRPQFRTGISPAKVPYEVLLTGGDGLASPVEKYTSAFRYENGAYRYVGRFQTKVVDDYIEKLIAHPSSKH